MSISIHKLRRLLLAGAVLLVAALAVLVGVARYRARHFLRDLPARLGADIKSETNGFTYSQSIKGKTLFTLHASKAIQRHNGKTTLHDVSIELYGRSRDEGKHVRADRISGAEFEYDQPGGVVRAAGEVHIDLQTPAGEAPHGPHVEDDGRVHMKTSGLTFDQKSGVARTDNLIEFHLNDVQGTATGAEYDSDAGVLMLKRDIHLTRSEDGKTSTLVARSATVDRIQHVAELQDAQYAEHGQTLHAVKMFIDLDEDGAPTRMRGEGVRIVDANGASITAPRGVASVGADRRVHEALLSGGVHYAADGASGEAGEARISLADGAGGIQAAEFKGAVHLLDIAGGGSRELRAQTVTFTPTTAGASTITASGGAQWSSAGDGETMQMKADVLHATMASAKGQAGLGGGEVRHVRGEGHTTLDQQAANGLTRHTTANVVDVALSPATAHKGGQKNAVAVEHAYEDGDVVIVERRAADAKQHRAASESHAYAQHAEFSGAGNMATLTGSPRVDAEGTTLSADRITLNQLTGDATAEGNVKGSLAAAGRREATHIIAGRAELRRSADLAVFYGKGTEDARLWQGSSQVIAPRIELQQVREQLRAYPAAGHPVRAVLPLAAASAGKGGKRPPMFAGAARISAQSLVYDGKAAHPTARLGGGVTVMQTAGTIRASTVTVTFKPGGTAGGAMAMPAGELEQVRAEGDVHLSQPGRTAAGALLVYTAAKDEFALTGSSATPPRIVDEERGTVTGDSLIFHAGDDSVIIAATPGKRVQTETRVDR